MTEKPPPVELLDAKPGQRQSNSCTECSRRKTRCDKKSPCEACVKRGKAHICRVPGHLSSSHSAPSSSSAPTDDLDLLAFTAFREVEDVRSTIDGLRTRVASLETLLLQAFGKLKEARNNGLIEVDLSDFRNGARGKGKQKEVVAEESGSNGNAHASTSSSEGNHDPRGASSIFRQDHTSAYEHAQDEDGEELTELREEEVAASLSLEYMASPVTGSPRHPTSPRFDPSSLPPNPINLFPTLGSLAGVIPPQNDAMTIIHYALEWTGWYHGAVHAPSFLHEVEEFWSAGEHRIELTNPAWLALFFAQLSCGIMHMTKERLAALGSHGLNEAEAKMLSKTLLDASIAALYRSNFIEVHHLCACQTIVILCTACQDGAFSNLFPTLLNVGIAIAQDLGLHRLPNRRAWEASVMHVTPAERTKSLIDYEIKKRIFWCLTTQDWYNISFRRTTAVQPSQITTERPANVRDEDLARGIYTERSANDYTIVSNLLIASSFGHLLQQLFAHIDENPKASYDGVLELDRKMQSIIDHMPAWMRDATYAEGTAPAVLDWIRTAVLISSYHKILTLHRQFLHRAFRDPLYETSRARALQASRAILREALKCKETRVWTVPYHISAAASVVCLDLFQKGSSSRVLDEEREEVRLALGVLKGMEVMSAIANRGVALVENLLAEESRLREGEMPSPTFSSASSSSRKRRRIQDRVNTSAPISNQASRPPKRAAGAGTSSQPSTSSLADSPLALTSPSLVSSLPLGPASTYAGASQNLSSAENAGEIGAFQPSAYTSMAELGFGTASSEANAVLPAEYLSVFLGSGFDPLDLLNNQTGWSGNDAFD